MPFDSNGVFSLTPGYLAVTGETIQPTQHNPPLEDLAAQGLSQVLVRDGRAPMTGDLKMNGFKATGLLAGTSGTDGVNKTQLDAVASSITASLPTYVTKAGNYTALDTDYGAAIQFSALATLAIDVTANLRTNWRIEVWADGGVVTIDPNSTNTINGALTLVLQQGQKAEIFKTSATTFQASVYGDPLSGPQLQGYLIGLALAKNGTDASNDIDIAVGKAAADVSPYYLMQLTGARTKRIDATWAVGTNAGGLDTGAVGNNTYYIWLIQRPDTGVVDALFSLSSTAPTMPTNYTLKRRIGSLVRAGGVNGVPTAEFPFGLVLGSLASLDITDLVYAGTSASNTNFPIGTTLCVLAAGINRNATSAIYIYTAGTIDWTATVDGAQIAGTWNARGLISASRQLFQRTA